MKITFRRRRYRTRQPASDKKRIVRVSTKVMIAARAARFIETLAQTVDKNPTTAMVAGAQDRDTAVERAVLMRPDVAIVDIDLGYDLGGIDVAFALRKINPTLGIVIVSPYSVPERLAMVPTGLGLEWSGLTFLQRLLASPKSSLKQSREQPGAFHTLASASTDRFSVLLRILWMQYSTESSKDRPKSDELLRSRTVAICSVGMDKCKPSGSKICRQMTTKKLLRLKPLLNSDKN